jgi:hypothetical protein
VDAGPAALRLAGHRVKSPAHLPGRDRHARPGGDGQGRGCRSTPDYGGPHGWTGPVVPLARAFGASPAACGRVPAARGAVSVTEAAAPPAPLPYAAAPRRPAFRVGACEAAPSPGMSGPGGLPSPGGSGVHRVERVESIGWREWSPSSGTHRVGVEPTVMFIGWRGVRCSGEQRPVGEYAASRRPVRARRGGARRVGTVLGIGRTVRAPTMSWPAPVRIVVRCTRRPPHRGARTEVIRRAPVGPGARTASSVRAPSAPPARAGAHRSTALPKCAPRTRPRTESV